MKRRPRPSLLVFLAFFASTSVYAGHGGGGGHSAGHSGGRGSSGHSIGHSFAHMFGHHSGSKNSQVTNASDSRADTSVLTSAIALNRFTSHPTPAGLLLGPRPRSVLRLNRHFNSGFCGSFGFSRHTFLFPGDFDCFGDPFFFDPFFSVGFAAGYLGSNSLVDAGDLSAVSGTLDFTPAVDDADAAFVDSTPVRWEGAEFPPDALSRVEVPVVLLQLKDGSMYGVTRYWFQDGRLYYVTTYGGENNVPLDRIDFPTTVKLNADRNVPFVFPDTPSAP
jgi:hypothetical protein